MLRRQVVAKVHWGAGEQEVTDWLQDEHGIVGAEADRLLADAFRARRRAVRERALIRVVLSAMGIAVAVAVIDLSIVSHGMILRGRAALAPLLAVGLGGYSVSVFVRSMIRLFSGETSGAVD